MNKNLIQFRKVQRNEIVKCCFFINKNLKIKINKDFYFWKYAINGSCSFIAIYKNEIIGHVGFTKYRISSSKKNIFSRHSSCVDPKFRRMGIYTNLINYAFNNFKKNADLVVIWPNKINKNTSKKILQYKIVKEYILYRSPGKNIFNNLISPLKKFSQISKYIKSNGINGIIFKNVKYFKWRYFSKYYKDRNTYFYIVENSLYLFNYNKLYNELNLIDYLGSNKEFYKNLEFISFKLKFNFWALSNSIMQRKLLKLRFKVKKKKFNNEIIFLKKNKFKYENFFFMSDTDSFINLSK